MIEKLAVRKMLASYELKLKKQMKEIDEERQRISDAFTTMEAKEIWWNSDKYAMLNEKWLTLGKVLTNIIYMRCSEELMED